MQTFFAISVPFWPSVPTIFLIPGLVEQLSPSAADKECLFHISMAWTGHNEWALGAKLFCLLWECTPSNIPYLVLFADKYPQNKGVFTLVKILVLFLCLILLVNLHPFLSSFSELAVLCHNCSPSHSSSHSNLCSLNMLRLTPHTGV